MALISLRDGLNGVADAVGSTMDRRRIEVCGGFAGLEFGFEAGVGLWSLLVWTLFQLGVD